MRIEIVRLKRAIEFWKTFKNDPSAIHNVIKNYFIVGYLLRPRFEPEIDAVVETIVNVKDKEVSLEDRIKAIELLEYVINNLGFELLDYTLTKILTNDVGREILSKSKMNMFEFAWKVATFNNSYSSKRLYYSEETIDVLNTHVPVMGISEDRPFYVIPIHNGYLLTVQSKNNIEMKKVDSLKLSELGLSLVERVMLK